MRVELEAAAVAGAPLTEGSDARPVVTERELGGDDDGFRRQPVEREPKRAAPDLVVDSADVDAVRIVSEAALVPVVASRTGKAATRPRPA